MHWPPGHKMYSCQSLGHPQVSLSSLGMCLPCTDNCFLLPPENQSALINWASKKDINYLLEVATSFSYIRLPLHSIAWYIFCWNSLQSGQIRRQKESDATKGLSWDMADIPTSIPLAIKTGFHQSICAISIPVLTLDQTLKQDKNKAKANTKAKAELHQHSKLKQTPTPIPTLRSANRHTSRPQTKANIVSIIILKSCTPFSFNFLASSQHKHTDILL